MELTKCPECGGPIVFGSEWKTSSPMLGYFDCQVCHHHGQAFWAIDDKVYSSFDEAWHVRVPSEVSDTLLAELFGSNLHIPLLPLVYSSVSV